MPRFVVLEHDHPTRHWDFMLEAGPTLRTWRLERPPAPGLAVRAEASFDHRLIYLDFEGRLSGDRGSVTRWDAGTFAWKTEGAECVVVRLDGERLRGIARLEHVDEKNWLLTWQDE